MSELKTKTQEPKTKLAIKKDNCLSYMNAYLLLDKNQALPFALSRHLMTCKSCRRQVKLLARAERLAAAPFTFRAPLTDKSIEGVLESLSPITYKRAKQRPYYLRYWIVAIVLVVSLLLAPTILTSHMQLRGMSVSYGIIVASCITGFCFAFAMANIDFFIKRVKSKIYSA